MAGDRPQGVLERLSGFAAAAVLVLHLPAVAPELYCYCCCCYYYRCRSLSFVVVVVAAAVTVLRLPPCSVSYSPSLPRSRPSTRHYSPPQSFLIFYSCVSHSTSRSFLNPSPDSLSPTSPATLTSTRTAATNPAHFSSPRAARYSSTRVFSPVSTDNRPHRE